MCNCPLTVNALEHSIRLTVAEERTTLATQKVIIYNWDTYSIKLNHVLKYIFNIVNVHLHLFIKENYEKGPKYIKTLRETCKTFIELKLEKPYLLSLREHQPQPWQQLPLHAAAHHLRVQQTEVLEHFPHLNHYHRVLLLRISNTLFKFVMEEVKRKE